VQIVLEQSVNHNTSDKLTAVMFHTTQCWGPTLTFTGYMFGTITFEKSQC